MTVEVRRVVDDEWGSSHIEPPCPDTDPLAKLQWHAAVLMADHGIRVEITMQRGEYLLSGDGWGLSGHRFSEAWALINGIAIGARAARRTEPS